MMRRTTAIVAVLILGASCAHAQPDPQAGIALNDIASEPGRMDFQTVMMIDEQLVPASARIIDLDASSLIARLDDGGVISWQLRPGTNTQFTARRDPERTVANGVNRDALGLLSGKMKLEEGCKLEAADSAYTVSMEPMLVAHSCDETGGSRLLKIFSGDGALRQTLLATLPGSVELLDVGVSPHPDRIAPVAIVLKDQVSGRRFLVLGQWYLQ